MTNGNYCGPLLRSIKDLVSALLVNFYLRLTCKTCLVSCNRSTFFIDVIDDL